MSDSQNPEEKPELVVDTDWKEQVAKEKAAAAKAASETATDNDMDSNTDNDSDAAAVDSAEAESAGSQPDSVASQPSDAASGTQAQSNEAKSGGEVSDIPAPPEASLEVLITMLFTQAMSMLGQIPDPNSGEAQVNKPFAKYYIDTMEMLEEKTKGNVTDDEARMLKEAMHALRMAYVNTRA